MKSALGCPYACRGQVQSFPPPGQSPAFILLTGSRYSRSAKNAHGSATCFVTHSYPLEVMLTPLSLRKFGLMVTSSCMCPHAAPFCSHSRCLRHTAPRTIGVWSRRDEIYRVSGQPASASLGRSSTDVQDYHSGAQFQASRDQASERCAPVQTSS